MTVTGSSPRTTASERQAGAVAEQARESRWRRPSAKIGADGDDYVTNGVKLRTADGVGGRL
jgi:hypothetical protein